MNQKRTLRTLILALGLGPLCAAAAPAPAAHAEATILVEADTGKVLEAENATYPWYPASVTKLMTAYVTLSAIKAGHITLDSLFTVSHTAAAQSPTKMGFPPGTQVTVDNALKMLMVHSANDMAVVLAEGVSGSIENFADEMTRTAHQLGMTQSNFVNPNGLPADGQITSARDLAILARALIHDFPEYGPYWHIANIKFGRRIIHNTNSLVGRYPGTRRHEDRIYLRLRLQRRRHGDAQRQAAHCRGARRAVIAGTRHQGGRASGTRLHAKSAGLADAGLGLGRQPHAGQRRSSEPARQRVRSAQEARARRGRRRGRQRTQFRRRRHAVLGAVVEPARANPERRRASVRLRQRAAGRRLYRADAHAGEVAKLNAIEPAAAHKKKAGAKTAAAKPDDKAADEKAPDGKAAEHKSAPPAKTTSVAEKPEKPKKPQKAEPAAKPAAPAQ